MSTISNILTMAVSICGYLCNLLDVCTSVFTAFSVLKGERHLTHWCIKFKSYHSFQDIADIT